MTNSVNMQVSRRIAAAERARQERQREQISDLVEALATFVVGLGFILCSILFLCAI